MNHLFASGRFAHIPMLELVPLVGLPLFWIAAFFLFAFKCAIWGMPRTERIDRIAKSPYLPRIFMEFGYWMFTLPISICVKLGITANAVTVGSMLLTIAAAFAYGNGAFALGGWTLFFAFTCDAWDGIIARKTNTSSPSGEYFDSTIDRYNDLIGFLGFMYYYRNDPFPLFWVAAAMVGSTLVSYTRAKGEAVGIDPNVGYMQRHERAVYLGLSSVFAPFVAAFVEPNVEHPRYHLVVGTMALMAVLTNITAIWRARVVLRGLKARATGASVPPVVTAIDEPDEDDLELSREGAQ